MKFPRYTLLICHKSGAPIGFTPKRLVFSEHGPSVPPSREELIEQEVREGVQLEKTQIEGFYLTLPRNPAIEATRLGVRTEIRNTLREQGMDDAQIQEGIINERVNSQLRTLTEHHVAEHHQQMGWVGQKLHSAGNTIRDISNPVRAVGRFFRSFGGGGRPDDLRYNTAEERHLQEQMEQLFGNNRDPDRIAEHVVDSIDDANLDGTNGAVNILRVGVLAPPIAARADIRTWLRTSDVSVLEAHLGDARRSPHEFLHSYELLLNVRRIQARERSKILSIDLYDPRRLRTFLETVRTGSAADHTLIEQILEPNALANLDADPAAQALVAHMMYLYEESGAPSFVLLHRHLDEIRNSLPEVKAKADQPEAEKADNIKTVEKIDEEYKNLRKSVIEVGKKYREAQSNARRLRDLQSQVQGFTTPPRTLNKFESDTLREMNKEIRELEGVRSDIFVKTNNAEQEYKDAAGQLVKTLIDSQKQAAPPGGTRLFELSTGAANPLSTENELFGLNNAATPPAPTPQSDLQRHIMTELTKTFFDGLTTQINDQYKKTISGRKRISARHLLVSLKERRLQDNGILDEGRRLKMAIFSANLMVADVKSIDLYRSGNREIAETMITGWRGWRRRASQSISSKFFNSNTFTARDIIDHVAEVDVEGKYEFLKGMNPESSLADVRHQVHEHHVSLDDLAGARAHLQKVLEGMKVGHHDRVEIADTSWTIENLTHNLLLLETELESREFFDKVQNPANPEDLKLSKADKAEYLKKLWAQTAESDKKRVEGVTAKLGSFPNTLKKHLMKGAWGKAYQEGLKEAKEKGLSSRDELKAYLQNEKKIPSAVLKHLMTGLALKEAWDIGSGAAKWVGGKLGKGAKGVARFGVEKGGGLMSSAWNRLIKPGAFATGRGLKKAGKFVAWDAPKFAFWTTPKFFMWDAPAWTLKKAKKAVIWPFALAGSIFIGGFNLFHYTPEKAERDRQWYEARKAKKAGHGGAHAAQGVPHGKPANDNAHGVPHGKPANDNAQGGEHKEAA